ncbi:MAG: triose-phosphate isomerase [Methanobacteriota archaeon]|jgi:triosephosphate isomerase|nr:MAG: triose-phosphate isomerase [Euryarchaeota archaeon]
MRVSWDIMSNGSPIIIVNLKAYEQGYGADGFDLCKIMEEISIEHNVNLAAAVSAIDLVDFSDNLKIPIFAQHVDGVNYGSHTGSILPEAVRYSGAVGTLVNHAECQMSWEEIEKTINRCKELGLLTVLCTADLESSEKGAHLNPDMIAVEPPELIGGDISVSTAKPEIISDTVELVKKINSDISVLCGAGVKNQTDVSKAISLGSEGILLASGVVKSSEPRKVLLDLIQGL